jgi:F-type H+-transporting ATPase subunit delta
LKKSKSKPDTNDIRAGLRKIFEDLELVESSLRFSIKLRGYLENPTVSFDDKVKTLRGLFKEYINNETYDLIFLLLRSNAISSLADILRNYKRTREDGGVMELEVGTPMPLSPEQRNSLARRFSERLGKPLTVKNIVDDGIIGGMIVKVGDIMIDASVRGALKSLMQKLRQR